MKKNLKVVEKSTKELLDLMGVDVDIEVRDDKDNEAILIDVDAKEYSGLLIGSRGESINSLQTIIGMIVRNKLGDWQRIIVNISDWREKQEDRLQRLAEQTAQRAMETGNPQQLYNLSAAERRIVHLYLSRNKSVTTESEGIGKDRYLIVTPKN